MSSETLIRQVGSARLIYSLSVQLIARSYHYGLQGTYGYMAIGDLLRVRTSILTDWAVCTGCFHRSRYSARYVDILHPYP